jgi:hypothetical protein
MKFHLFENDGVLDFIEISEKTLIVNLIFKAYQQHGMVAETEANPIHPAVVFSFCVCYIPQSARLIVPGIAQGYKPSEPGFGPGAMSHAIFFGKRSSVDLNAASHETSLPEYVANRPRIAVIEAIAPCFPAFSFLPFMIASNISSISF